MPELPEVETIRRDLQAVLKGRRVVSLRVTRPKLLRNPRPVFTKVMVGSTISKVERRAKQLVLHLSSGFVLLIHLKMTGQLVWQAKAGKMLVGGHPVSGVTGVPNRYTYITLAFDNGSHLYFNDVRQFGYWRLVPISKLADVFSPLGPEPLAREFTRESLKAALARRSRTSIKAALLDQRVVAGIGNIYADESLFLARVSPAKRVGDLSARQVTDIWTSIRAVLKKAVAARGTSFSTYRDGLGRSGTYWDKRLVYGRAGEPCVRCGSLLRRSVVAGRGTVSCRHCQH